MHFENVKNPKPKAKRVFQKKPAKTIDKSKITNAFGTLQPKHPYSPMPLANDSCGQLSRHPQAGAGLKTEVRGKLRDPWAPRPEKRTEALPNRTPLEVAKWTSMPQQGPALDCDSVARVGRKGEAAGIFSTLSAGQQVVGIVQCSHQGWGGLVNQVPLVEQRQTRLRLQGAGISAQGQPPVFGIASIVSWPSCLRLKIHDPGPQEP